MTDSCDHRPMIELLTRLEESEQYDELLMVAGPAFDDLEGQGDIQSLRAATQIRRMAMKALAVTDREDEAVELFEETHRRYASQSDQEILFWLNSAAIACADSYWQGGKT